jgi:hypothetical protein
MKVTALPVKNRPPSSCSVDVLEQLLGAVVVETKVEHEPPDGPATEAECVEPASCVAVERLRIGVRLDWCVLRYGLC